MKLNSYFKIIVSVLIYLIVSLPIIFAQELNLQYDAVGNLVTGDSFYREYDGFNHLIRIRQGNTSSGNITEEFIWRPIEERIFIKKIYWNNQSLRTTIKYLNKNTIKIKNESGTFYENYIYQDDILVAQVDTNGNKVAVHSDHEGSSTTFTNAQGNVIETTFYSAYGEILSGGKTSRFDYEGKEYDSLVKDYDFGFRKYNPDVPPMFYQPDDRIRAYDPQSLNPYAYARNNPYNRIDPDGQFWQLLIPGIVGATIATGAYLLTHDDWSFGQGLEYAEAGFIGATIGTYGGILGSSGGAVISQVLINDAENRRLNENLKEAATIGAFTFWYIKFFTSKIHFTVIGIFIISKIGRWFYVFYQANSGIRIL